MSSVHISYVIIEWPVSNVRYISLCWGHQDNLTPSLTNGHKNPTTAKMSPGWSEKCSNTHQKFLKFYCNVDPVVTDQCPDHPENIMLNRLLFNNQSPSIHQSDITINQTLYHNIITFYRLCFVERKDKFCLIPAS